MVVVELLDSIKSEKDSLYFLKDVLKDIFVPSHGFFLKEVNGLSETVLNKEAFFNNILENRVITPHVLKPGRFPCVTRGGVIKIDQHWAVIKLSLR